MASRRGRTHRHNLERQCARLAELIWTGKVKNRKGFVESLAELNTTDDEFRTSCATQENLTKQKAVYLLKRIEEHERLAKFGASGKGLGPQSDLSLEHILPDSPGKE